MYNDKLKQRLKYKIKKPFITKKKFKENNREIESNVEKLILPFCAFN